jgi:hypothetical protein
MKMNLIEYEGFQYIFYNTLNEKKNMFIDRTWFMVKNINKFDYVYLEKLSFIWINMKYLGATYDAHIPDLDQCSIYEEI